MNLIQFHENCFFKLTSVHLTLSFTSWWDIRFGQLIDPILLTKLRKLTSVYLGNIKVIITIAYNACTFIVSLFLPIFLGFALTVCLMCSFVYYSYIWYLQLQIICFEYPSTNLLLTTWGILSQNRKNFANTSTSMTQC